MKNNLCTNCVIAMPHDVEEHRAWGRGANALQSGYYEGVSEYSLSGHDLALDAACYWLMIVGAERAPILATQLEAESRKPFPS